MARKYKSRKYYAGALTVRNEFHSPGWSRYISVVYTFETARERDWWVWENYAWRGALLASYAQKLIRRGVPVNIDC